jgi:uncharacterized membrane protein
LLLARIHHAPRVGPPGRGWLVAAAGVALLLLVGVVVCLLWRRPGGVGRGRRDDLAPAEAEMLAMLWRTGRPVDQTEIAKAVSLDSEKAAEAIRDLEARGLIRRQWDGERQTYGVRPV